MLQNDNKLFVIAIFSVLMANALSNKKIIVVSPSFYNLNDTK
jgi:hypothetical protein